MREQYTLDFSESIASEIIQKYEPIEEGMTVLQSFKYLYANWFLLIAVINFKLDWVKFLLGNTIYIDSFNFVTYRQHTYLLESYVV